MRVPSCAIGFTFIVGVAAAGLLPRTAEAKVVRLAIEHRGWFVNAVTRAAFELVRERFLLPQDATRFIQLAEASDVLR